MTKIEQIYTQIFHTVPFTASELTRLPDGSKTNPGFPNNWVQYASKRNTKATPLLGAIAREDFIGIDIDSTPLFNEALKLAGECEYIAKSDLKGGHLLYAYNSEDAKRLQAISKDAKAAKIDIQMGNKLIYLATPANKTKTLLTDPLVKPLTQRVPKLLIQLIESHSYRALLNSPAAKIISNTHTSFNPALSDNSTLGYLLETEEYNEDIIDRVVPKSLDYRHPRDIPFGEGTYWMNSVRFKLANDPSVSEDKFIKFMLYLNSQWEDPMPEDRVLRDCKYDIKNEINPITGGPLWRYNKDWKTEGFTYPDLFGNMLEIMYDPAQQVFIEHNRNTNNIVLYSKQTDVVNAIMSKGKGRQKWTGEKILKKADPVELVNTPEKRPGKIIDKYKISTFNMFRPSEGVMILNGLIDIKEPQHPENTLKFFENLIVDESNRMRLFKFLAHKHKTYEYSSLYFVLAGVGGAGKGLFINLFLEYFAGPDRMQSADIEKLVNNFNSWQSRTDYVIIDEAGEGESKNQQAKLVKKLKELTGKPTVNITFKGKETGGSERHFMTPVLTTNMNVKLITDSSSEDRRLVLFKCPNKLSKITDDAHKFVDILKAELPHFAYYLKNLPDISHHEYTSNIPWKNEDYYEYIETTQEPIDKMVEAVENQNLDKMLEILMEDLSLLPSQIDELFTASKRGEEPRLLLYNTTATRELNIASLVDIAETTSLLDAGEVKIKFKKLKKKVIYYTNDKKYNMQVLAFKGDYKPLINDEVEPITDKGVEI